MSEITPIIAVLAVVGSIAVAALAVSLVNILSSSDDVAVGTVTLVDRMPDGTEALPGMAFFTDDRTGIYRQSDGDFGISVSGSTGLSVSADGMSIHVVQETPAVPEAGSVKVFSSAANQVLAMGVDGVSKQITDQDFGMKAPVRLATTANGALATAYAAGQTIDGLTIVTGDRILLKDQADAKENGVYVATTGIPARSDDFKAGAQFSAATRVGVSEGTTNGGKQFMVQTKPASVGVNNWTWAPVGLGNMSNVSVGLTPNNPFLMRFGPLSTLIGDTDTALPNQNTIIGHNMGSPTFTGLNNVVMGLNGAQSLTSAGNSVLIGAGCAGSLASGSSNTIIGNGADCGAASDTSVVVGASSGTATMGSGNVLLGGLVAPNLGASNDNNIAIGRQVMSSVSGSGNTNNIAMGFGTMFGSGATTNADGNIAIGTLSMSALTTGDRNIAISSSAGTGITTGSNNIFLGNQAGNTVVTGGGNICVGASSDAGAAQANSVALGNGIIASQDASFNVIHRTIAATSVACEWNGNELIQVSSSRRYKHSIEDLDLEMKDFMGLRPVTYKAKKENCVDPNDAVELERRHIGFIAEEAEEHFPGLVAYGRNVEGQKIPESFAYKNMTAVLTKVVQMQQNRIEAQEQRLDAQEQRIASLLA